MTPSEWSGLQAVLFDLDGTLIDSTESYYRLVETALDQLGLPAVSRPDILKAAETDPFDWLRILPQAVHHRRDTIIPAAWKIIDEAHSTLFNEKMTMFNGAVDIMQRLVANGLKLGIVTSTPRKNLRLKMRALVKMNVAHLVEVIVNADDTLRKKPAPDPLVRCAKLLKTPVTDCVYIGDTCADIQAGKSAGMKTIAVLSGFDDVEALAAEQPDAVIKEIGCLFEVLPFH